MTVPPSAKPERLAYPLAPAGTQTDTLHGTVVADPYRWLEDPDSAATQAWVAAENRVTQGVLATLTERDGIRERLRQVWNHPRYTAPVHEGNRWFFRKNDGLQNQAVLYVAEGSVDATPSVLLDPNLLAADGTAALVEWQPSRDGRKLGYGIAKSGSDWVELRVRDIDAGRDLPDVVQWAKFTAIAWAPDGSGFWYSRYDAPKPGEELRAANYFHKLCFHRLGTPQDADPVVFERKDQKEWGFGGAVTDDGAWLVVQGWKGADNKNRVWVQALARPGVKAGKAGPTPWLEVIADFDAEWSPIANDGSRFWFRTDKGAPKGRIVQFDVRDPAPAKWKTIVPEGPDTLDVAVAVGDRLAVHRMRDARSVLTLYQLDGTLVREVPLPGLGSAESLTARRQDETLFFTYASFVQPLSVLRHDIAAGTTTDWRVPDLGLRPTDWKVDQEFATSKDGTKVPVFIARHRDTPKDGARPTWLFGYGGFNVSMTPFFSTPNLVWMERGGVFAMAVLRGGGEYGEAWHTAGQKQDKQHVFDDFIAAAEHLQRSGWTRPGRTAIAGGSNGGLLVGACMTQRPELFGAALPGVGVMDMLRFHKFTIGWAWVPEYGSADVADQFPALRAYSPLHNLKPGTRYPATLVTTADHDDRVVPGHSFKFAAALQAAQAPDGPAVLIRIDVKAGHGAGKPTAKLIEEAADKLSFARWALQADQ
ncbi:MAG: S9 family peptidase [Myxococcales bacterium]|nr:S9 family peptidase [Myxococcales bacterium]